MTEHRNGNKAIQIHHDMAFYGQYYKEWFQVLESCDNTDRKVKNMAKRNGFEMSAK
jgi:hypothetical protein